VFPVHLAVAHARKAAGKPGHPSPEQRRRRVVAAIAAVALSAGLAPGFSALLGGVHGDAAAAGILIGLLSAGFGFGLARVIGRQR